MKYVYYMGRILQLAALMVLPYAIWVGQLGHDERGAIVIFAGSIIVFFAGWFLAGRRG